MFTCEAPNRLWVTDITEHRTYEGKVYCAVVLDTFSRRVVGWSIDSSQTAALVTNALGMAIANRDPQAGGVIHSDHGVQGGFNWSSQHPVTEVLSGPSTTSSRPSDSVAGHPKYQRHVEVAFWEQIAKGPLAEEAAAVIGVAQAVGARSFHDAGGCSLVS